MVLITDEMVIEAVRSCGTATAGMIYDWIGAQLPDQPRDVISSRGGRRLKQLVKYRFVETMMFDNKKWYYLTGEIPNPIAEGPRYSTDRIRDLVFRAKPGQFIPLDEFIEVGRCTKSHVRKTLATMDGVSKVGIAGYVKDEA